MKKINNKKEKGITLIALVITIIILLILAGVTISTLTGNNGLIEKAKESKTKAEIAKVKEEIQTDILGKEVENKGNISEDNLKEILERYGTLSEEEKLIDKTLKTKENYEIKVSDILNEIAKEDEPENPTTVTVANAPDIDGFNKNNTYYVSWDLTNSPYAINENTPLIEAEPSNWYDYTEGVNHWANIKTTGGGNDCYWVWIPRYAYKVPKKSNRAQTLEVKFLQGNTNIPIGETEAITNTTPNPETWVVHPAFTNSGNGGFGELTGIWVAKYEASSNSSNVVENPTANQLEIDGGSAADIDLKVRVKPNVTSWRGIMVGNIFIVCKNLTTNGNSLVGTTNIDSHMMKNTEWGAVAYLSRSVYGKNERVYNNPYYNNTKNFSPITGLCGNKPDYKTTTYNDKNTYKYNTAEGVNASTSGNVYGIYDMAGGAWEYVAGILNSKKSNNNYYDFSNTDTKYYDSYDDYNDTKYGDAIYETSTNSSQITSWYTAWSSFLEPSHPVFIRGGHANSGSGAGVFAFYGNSGITSTYNSFRPCLVSPQK